MSDSFLRITMPDGSKWDVPAELIAEHRASHYAEKDTGKSSGPEYLAAFRREVHWLLGDERVPGDENELADWAANNMNWEDVAAHAVQAVPPAAGDYQEGWVNGEKELIRR